MTCRRRDASRRYKKFKIMSWNGEEKNEREQQQQIKVALLPFAAVGV